MSYTQTDANSKVGGKSPKNIRERAADKKTGRKSFGRSHLAVERSTPENETSITKLSKKHDPIADDYMYVYSDIISDSARKYLDTVSCDPGTSRSECPHRVEDKSDESSEKKEENIKEKGTDKIVDRESANITTEEKKESGENENDGIMSTSAIEENANISSEEKETLEGKSDAANVPKASEEKDTSEK